MSGVLACAISRLGALGSRENVVEIAAYLEKYTGYVVCDPVLNATAGGELIKCDAIETMIQFIFPHVTLLTPNIPEVEILLNRTIQTADDIQWAAKQLLKTGVKSVLIKGGHLSGPIAYDYFESADHAFWLNNFRLPYDHIHGTGCTLSAAITAALGLGYDILDALVIGKMYVNQGIRQCIPIDNNVQRIAHHGWPQHQYDLPWITQQASSSIPSSFPKCDAKNLGFYPIVDSVSWVRRLLSRGVRTIQLRIKNQSKKNVESAIIDSIHLARHYRARLFINDYWELAIKHHAYGVHLGQSDLMTAKIQAIREAKLHLGISTHCFYEIAHAHADRPSYIAFGPIYATTSKSMHFSPRGLQQLEYWKQVLNYPLVAIGGITLERLSDVLATGVDGIAVISAITQSPYLNDTIQNFLKQKTV